MRISNSMFHHLPIARKLLAIVAAFVVIVICVFFRRFPLRHPFRRARLRQRRELVVQGTEARRPDLTKYAEGRAEKDYQDYLAEIAVPLGDKQARLQLESPSPDMRLVYEGFVQGRISPEDVRNMTMLFRRFGNFGYMRRAIAVWTAGDREVDQLRALADQLHAEISSLTPTRRRFNRSLTRSRPSMPGLLRLKMNSLPLWPKARAGSIASYRSATLIATVLLLLIGIGVSSSVLNQIRHSQEKYHSLINTANDAILVIDSETHVILEANDQASKLLGYSPDHLAGMPESRLHRAVPGGSSPSLLAMQSAALQSNREIELLRSDGSPVPVEVTSSATEFGGRSAVLGMFRDLRDRHEAAAVLRRSEERFSYLIQNLSDVITVVAVDGTMLYQSPSIERVAGYRPTALLGKSFLSFVHPEDEPAIRAALERVTLRVGSAAPPEFRFRHFDGTWVWLEAIVNNLLNDVAVGGIVVTSRNVTGRRVLEDQVRQSQKMEAVGRLAGGIAHDFNNLLMVIQGYAEIVLQEEGVESTTRKNVETILRATESAANLTRQLLSFSRKHAFSQQVLDLNSLVNRMSEMLLGVLSEEMEFVVRLSPDPCCISADPGQVEQVIMNLVVNARDAMRNGGTLTLRTARVGSDVVRAGKPDPVEPGDYVMLAVSDTGIGMDAETQSRIFEPFFTTKSRDEGTGLGMSVVYNIVRGSGGHVRLISEPGKGSTLHVFFPRVAEVPTAEVRPAPTEPTRAGPETILVAEDQPDLRWMICQFLQSLGYSVLEATNGSDAVALAEQYKGPIDVVLTDVVMPHVRGPEVALKLASARPDIKIIYMSGYTEGEISAIGGESNVAQILQKPFELDFLAAKIREVLEARTRH